MGVTAELRPLIYIILNFIVGYLVASGHLDPAQKDLFITNGETAIGGGIITATASVTLYRAFKHPHQQSATKTTTIKEEIKTPDEPIVPIPGLPTENTPLPL